MSHPKFVAEPAEPIACGEVPLAPYELTHRTELELAAALADNPPARTEPRLATKLLDHLRSALPRPRALGRGAMTAARLARG